MLIELMDSVGVTSIKIIAIPRVRLTRTPQVTANVLSRMGSTFPDLQIVLYTEIRRSTNTAWPIAVTSLPKLTTFQFSHGGSVFTSDNAVRSLNSESITMINYFDKHGLFPYLQDCHLPALRSLRLETFPYTNSHLINRLMTVTEALGHNLRLLQVGIRIPSTLIMPEDLWRFCPQLERLDTDLCLHYPPPPDHPLRTVSTFNS